MVGPDLSYAQSAVEELMEDTCVVSRSTAPDILVVDEGTGELVPAPGSEVYAGPCTVSPGAGNTDRIVTEGGVSESERIYTLGLPAGTLAKLEPDVDTVTVTGSLRDQLLVDQTFVVRSVLYRTMLVSRRYTMELRQ